MRHKFCFSTVLFWNLLLPNATVFIECWKYRSMSFKINTFGQFGDRLRDRDCHSIEFPKINSTLDCTIHLQSDEDWWSCNSVHNELMTFVESILPLYVFLSSLPLRPALQCGQWNGQISFNVSSFRSFSALMFPYWPCLMVQTQCKTFFGIYIYGLQPSVITIMKMSEIIVRVTDEMSIKMNFPFGEP